MRLRTNTFAYICCLFPIGYTSATFAAAPKVVRTFPADGDKNVDINLKELLVEFDQDMNQTGFSWTGGPPTFPKTNGAPKWTSPRICVVPVILEPNKEYKFGINGPSHKSFRNKAGEPAEPVGVTFRTVGADGKPVVETKLSKESNQKAIDVLRKQIDERYSYRDLRGVDWDKKFAEHKDKLLAAATAEQFAQETAELLKAAGDIHIWIDVEGGQRVGTTGRAIDGNFSWDVLGKVVPGIKRANDTMATGRFEDGIGYIKITTWEASALKDAGALIEALKALADTKAIVIDVRANSGGSEPIAEQFAGCFVEEPKLYAKHVTRDPSQPGGWTPVRERTLKPSATGPKYRGKVAVLMGKKNMSSCEAFLLMMRQTPQCKLFGETTWGSSGNPQPYNLGNGVTVFLPSWKAMTPDGTVFEGKGIKPDVEVLTKPADFKDKDPVLVVALEWLRQK